MLLSKYYIERGVEEVDAFKNAASSLQLQHHGHTVYSHYIEPSCQRLSPGSGTHTAEFFNSLGRQRIDEWSDDDDVEGFSTTESRKNSKPLDLFTTGIQNSNLDEPKSPLHYHATETAMSADTGPEERRRTARQESTLRKSGLKPPKGAYQGKRSSSKTPEIDLSHRNSPNEALPTKFGEIFLFVRE